MTLLLNLVVWLSLSVVFMMGIMFALKAIRIGASDVLDILHGIYASIINVIVDWDEMAYSITDLFYYITQGQKGLSWLLIPAIGIGIVFLIWSVYYSIRTRFRTGHSYSSRRYFEKNTRWLLWIGVSLLAVGFIPNIAIRFIDRIYAPDFSFGELLGPVIFILTFLGGIGGAEKSYFNLDRDNKGNLPISVIAPLACVFLLAVLVIVSYIIAMWYIHAAGDFAWLVFCVWLFFSIVTGFYVNLNYISIHRYYRDRIMEAFMPHPYTCGKTTDATDADKAYLKDMCSTRGPYHLVNTNVILVDSDDSRWRLRGGDSFLLSPKYCGSTATGWVKTAKYMKKDQLTLPTAVAISGAAANPNTAAGGVGPTRKRLLSLLMALLNIRMGYWVPNPRNKSTTSRIFANHFRSASRELSPRGFAERQKLVQISDGGHFENLGVYELIRRRVKLIVCCDASADPEFKFTNLQTLLRRIRTDFGVRIEFDSQNQLERLIPRDPEINRECDPDRHSQAYPLGAKFAEQGHIKGTIIYRDENGDETKGTLILLKTTMTKDLGLLLKGYKSTNPSFPDQSTFDQFFDEEQFDAYRELGYNIAEQMIKDTEGVGIEGELEALR